MYIHTFLILIIAFFVFPHNTGYGISLLILALITVLTRYFVTDNDTLEARRAKYARRIEKFYKRNKPRVILKNDNVIIRFIVSGKKQFFYCISRNNNKGFQFGGNSQNAAAMAGTLWGLIDMEFEKNTEYDDIIKLFKEIYPPEIRYANGQNPYHYFQENILTHVINFKDKNYKLKLKQDNSGRKYIICSETEHCKGKRRNKRKTGRRYIIRADEFVITEIIYDYRYSKINDFLQSYQFLSKRDDCEIKFYDKTDKNETKQNADNINSENLFDINKITEEEFVKLPGVNVILAKRIVRQREEIDGFKTKEEFYEFCKFKPHFIEQLNNLISVGEFDILDVILREEERTVDTIDDYGDTDNDTDIDEDEDIIVDL